MGRVRPDLTAVIVDLTRVPGWRHDVIVDGIDTSSEFRAEAVGQESPDPDSYGPTLRRDYQM